MDRALTGFAKALVAARDMGVVSHEMMCAEADQARAVQNLVWACKKKFEKNSTTKANKS